MTPIFKKGSKADINNYRPISVLPIIKSIFERHISNCLVDYLESNNLLYNRQSGFRRLHSCQTALTKIVDNWHHAINNSETVGTVFLDLTKAFDLVNHKLLIQVRSGDQDYSCSMLLYHVISTTCSHAGGWGSTALAGHSSRSMLVSTQN